jgi:APA family basic amino acid/polyamine antiporter
MPATGGLYVYCKRVLGPGLGFFYLALLLITHILIALFALGFAQYALALVPGLPARGVAVGILALFFFVNLFGVRVAALLQRVMIVVLVLGLTVLVAFGWGAVNPAPFQDPAQLFPQGAYGFALACVILSFATGGAQFISELGGEMANPERDLPRAMLGATLTAALLFTLVSVVAVGVLPLEQTAGQSLAKVAEAILPAPLYLAFIVGAGLFALATSINATFSWATKAVLIACEDGWLPRSLAVVHPRFGTPHRLLLGLFLLGATPIALGWELRYLIMIGGGLVFIYDTLPLLAAFLLPRRLPEVFARARMRLSARRLQAVSVLALLVVLGQAALSFSDVDGVGWALVGAYLLLVAGYVRWRGRTMIPIKFAA